MVGYGLDVRAVNLGGMWVKKRSGGRYIGWMDGWTRACGMNVMSDDLLAPCCHVSSLG